MLLGYSNKAWEFKFLYPRRERFHDCLHFTCSWHVCSLLDYRILNSQAVKLHGFYKVFILFSLYGNLLQALKKITSQWESMIDYHDVFPKITKMTSHDMMTENYNLLRWQVIAQSICRQQTAVHWADIEHSLNVHCLKYISFKQTSDSDSWERILFKNVLTCSDLTTGSWDREQEQLS